MDGDESDTQILLLFPQEAQCLCTESNFQPMVIEIIFDKVGQLNSVT